MDQMSPYAVGDPAAVRTMYGLSQPDLDEVAVRFTYHKPHGDQPRRYELLRSMAKALAELVYDSCPPSRERSIALTKLEEAVMWANAAIARNEKEG